MKILFAADGSQYTKGVLHYLGAHPQWLDPVHEYTVLHCVLKVPHRAGIFERLAVVRGLYDDDAESVLRPIRAFFEKHAIDAKFVYEIGSPARHIAALAEAGKFDLLIMGSRGLGTFAGFIFRSVATRVLSSCTTPILLVR